MPFFQGFSRFAYDSPGTSDPDLWWVNNHVLAHAESKYEVIFALNLTRTVVELNCPDLGQFCPELGQDPS